MTYRQNMDWIEDGYGEVTVRFVVSDTFEGLQATDTLSTVANIFEINSITKKTAGKNGGFIQNTLEFNITQSKVHTTVEKACLTFIKSAIVPTTRRYAGVFINPTGNDGEPDISNHEDMFMGLIQNTFESEDILWTLTATTANPSGFYETNVNALSEWKIDAKPYNDSVFSEIKLSQLIYGDEANDIPGIDSTWEAGYVGEAQGYYSHDIYTVKTDKVVNLNRLLLKLIDNFQIALENKGFGTYDIILDKCELDGKWHPARWFHSTVPVNNGEVRDENTRYTGQVFSPDPNQPSFYFYKQYPMFYPDDYIKLEINGTETMADAKSPWISYRMVKYPPSFLPEGLEGLQPTCTTEGNYRLDRLANIFSLFDEIAENFGIFYQLYWETSTELHVKFTSRQDFIQDTVFFKTAIKSSTKYSAGDITSKYYYGEAGNYCQDEGWNTYGSKMEDGLSFTYQNTVLQRDQTDKKRISFTISPLVKLVNRMLDNAVGTGDDLMTMSIIEGGYRPLGIPHGHIFCNDGTDQLAYGENAFGIHTGIYLYVPYYLDHPPVNNEPSAYWTPAIALTINIRGTDKSYFKLSDYLNDIVEGDVKFYQAEINLECPCIMGFLPEDPNNTGYPDFTEIPNWNNCDVGKLIIKDGVHYTVTEVKWLVKEKKTTMVCHNAERFDITDITTTEFSMTENSDKYLKPSLISDSSTVKTNSSDLLAGFLTDKIVADDNIDIDLVDVNGVKNLSVKGLGKVKVDAGDAASGFLWDKISSSSLSLSLTSIDVGAGVKKLNIEVPPVTGGGVRHLLVEVPKAALLALDTTQFNLTVPQGSTKVMFVHRIFEIPSAVFDYTTENLIYLNESSTVQTYTQITLNLLEGHTAFITPDLLFETVQLTPNNYYWLMNDGTAVTDNDGNSGSLWLLMEYEIIDIVTMSADNDYDPNALAPAPQNVYFDVYSIYWDEITGITNYEVAISIDNSTWQLFMTGAYSFGWNFLEAFQGGYIGQTFYLKVRANGGGVSEWSEPVTVTQAGTLAAITNFAVALTTTIDLTWDFLSCSNYTLGVNKVANGADPSNSWYQQEAPYNTTDNFYSFTPDSNSRYYFFVCGTNGRPFNIGPMTPIIYIDIP